jgi:site-specific DNA recombinase
MSNERVAIYARVSSDQQAEAHTIDSQVAALRQRVRVAGAILLDEMQFIDDGYTGTMLTRPALERLRDRAAMGDIDQLYVFAPDRLARKYAYQVLLLEELQRAGVEVIFLNRSIGQNPEDELLLQVQGVVAEYERAQFMERSRRGRRHAAQQGAVSVLANAPYGYQYRHRHGEPAIYEVNAEEAQVVRQVFGWVGRDRLSLGEVCRRLTAAEIPTRRGKARWDRSVIWGMLKNTAYAGKAVFGRTRSGPWHPGLRVQQGRQPSPHRPVTPVATPPSEWITVPVPALIDEQLFDQVQEQLAENRVRARQARRGARYLLQGLVVCAQCGYAYYGTCTKQRRIDGQDREYGYYRCIGSERYRFGGEQRCHNTPLYTSTLDEAVWREVRDLLEHPDRLHEEYQRRLQQRGPENQHQIGKQLQKYRQSLSRLIDIYAEGLIEKDEFEPRSARLRQQMKHWEAQEQLLQEEDRQRANLQVLMGQLEEFTATLKGRLGAVEWGQQRDIIRMVVKRVDIDAEQIRVVFRLNPDPFLLAPERGISQLCWRRLHIPLRKCGTSYSLGLHRKRGYRIRFEGHHRPP